MAGAVNIRLGAIITDFLSGMQSARNAVGQLATQINGNLAASFAAADRQSRQFARGIGRVSNSLTSFGKQASIASAAISAIGIASFKTYADIDGIQRALTVTTGSVQEATKQFGQFIQLSKLPGLGLEEVVQAGLQFEVLGYQAQTAQKYVSEVGNAIALGGKGKAEFDSVITQFVQMSGKAKVLAEDLKPIITASPVIGKAIADMFGTVDSEQISAKLQAAGRSPKDFINDLVTSLSGLERVQGGPKNAIENLGDSIKLALFSFGQAADKAFGLTGFLDRLGNGATSLADRFAKLDPVTQKVALTAVGLAVAIGPLTLGIGGLLALIPSMIAGAAALSTTFGIALGPIALVGVAIAGLAVIIATNWGSIRNTLTQTGVWQTLKDLASSAFSFLRALFTTSAGYLQAIWARFGGFFTGATKTAFEGVIAVFTFAANLIRGILQTLTGILTGNWKQAFEGMGVVFKSFWNLIVDGFKLLAGAVGRSIGAIFQLFGADTLAEKINAGIDKAIGKLDKLKGTIRSTQTVAQSAATITGVTGTKKTPTDKPFDYSAISLNGSAYEQAKDRLKKLKDEIASGKLQGLDVSAKQAEYDKLKASIDSATGSFKNQTSSVGSLNTSLTTNERILKRLTQQLKEQGDTADKSLSRQVALFQELVDLDKKRANFKPVDIGQVNPLASIGGAQRVNSILNGSGATTAGIGGISATIGLPGIGEFQRQTSQQLRDARLQLIDDKQQFSFALSDIPNVFGSIKDEMKRVVESDPLNSKGLVTAVLTSAQAISGAIKQAKANLVSGGIDLLASIGEGLASGKLTFKSIIKSVIDLIADAVIAIGKVMITTGIPLALFPATAPLGLKQILTGGAIVLAGGIAKGLASSLLSDNVGAYEGGGLFRGNSIIRVGESAKALAGGGEFVSPVNLGADLISARIMKNIGIGQFNRPDVSQVRPQRVLITHQGEFRLNKGDLVVSLADAQQTNSYYN